MAGEETPAGRAWKMLLHRVAHWVYVTARNALTAAGLFGPLRRWAGPLAGRSISRWAAGTRRPTMVRGHQMFLAPEGGYPPVAMAMDRYEAGTTRLFQRLLKPGMVVVDVGSHVGYYTLLAARQVGPTGRVYAFEPEQGNHDLLLKNIRLNGYSNVTAVRKAVSNKVGSAALYLTALDSGRHSTYHLGLPEKGSVHVETTTIDAFLAEVGWPKVDLVKVDVEGAEMDVLEGARQLQVKCPDVKMIVEFGPSMLQSAGTDPHLFLNCLVDRGLEVHWIRDGGESSPLHEADRRSMVERLLKSQTSVNLYCCGR